MTITYPGIEFGRELFKHTSFHSIPMDSVLTRKNSRQRITQDGKIPVTVIPDVRKVDNIFCFNLLTNLFLIDRVICAKGVFYFLCYVEDDVHYFLCPDMTRYSRTCIIAQGISLCAAFKSL